MICPRCNGKTTVYDSARNTKENESYRKRKCLECGHKFCTIEYEVDCDENYQKNFSKYVRYNRKDRKLNIGGNPDVDE